MLPTDPQFAGAVSRLPSSLANGLRDLCMAPKEKEERKKLMEKIPFIKTVAAVVAVISVLVFAFFPSWGFGCLAALISYGAFELCTVLSNTQQIFDDFTVEAKVHKNEQALLEQMSKGTLFARNIIPLFW